VPLGYARSPQTPDIAYARTVACGVKKWVAKYINYWSKTVIFGLFWHFPDNFGITFIIFHVKPLIPLIVTAISETF
jgi:hypothetical protein